VVTTVMTSPLLRLVYPPRVLARDIAAAEKAALGLVDAYTVLVAVDDPAHDQSLVHLACDLVGRESPAQVVLTRVVRRTTPKPEIASGLGADLALIASAGLELRDLARLVEARGIRASVASRFTETPWADVAEIAGSSDADVVLARRGWGVPEGAAVASPWPASLQGTVVLVSGELGEPGLAPHGPIAVLPDGDADGRAALRLAAQAAMARSVPLQLRAREGWRAGRRVTGLAEGLRRVGVAVADVDDPAALPSLLVAPAGSPTDEAAAELTPVLTVHAGAADSDRDLEETLAGIAAGPGTV
jgi:K+:H+ antiporter